MNNANTRIDLVLDCISLWGKLERFRSYKSPKLIKEIETEYYDKLHKLMKYEHEIDERGCKCGKL